MKYVGNDFYCDIAIPGNIELKKEYESETVLAYHHTRPHWPVHIVVVPKIHIGSLTTVASEDEAIMKELFQVVQMLAKKVEDEYGAARVLTNLGTYQDSKHLHIHVCSGDPSVLSAL